MVMGFIQEVLRMTGLVEAVDMKAGMIPACKNPFSGKKSADKNLALQANCPASHI